MKRHQRRSANSYMFYNEATEPALPAITTPIPRNALPRESWMQRISRGLGTFFRTIINKINQLLALALATLLLLLFTRFILSFFQFSGGSSFSFSYWVFFLSTPLIAPFQNLFPALPFNGYIIEVSTLIAILAYTLGVTIVRQLLRVLVAQ